jgi:hypothetical protein
LSVFNVKSFDVAGFEFFVSYDFSDEATRKSRYGSYGSYGGSLPFSTLYKELVAMNGGRYFIEEYFTTVFNQGTKQDVERMLNGILKEHRERGSSFTAFYDITEEMITKKGKLDRRFNLSKDFLASGLDEQALIESILSSDSSYLDKLLAIDDDEFEDIRYLIKEDLEQSLRNGLVPLNFRLKEASKKRRVSAGISPHPPFVATGQLLNDLEIFIGIEVKHE